MNRPIREPSETNWSHLVKFFAAFLLLILPSLAFSQHMVSGNQSGTWTSADSPYFVVGDIMVPGGQTLTIEPGVVVNFQNHYQFSVEGNLQAVGAENDTIRFTTDNPAVGWGGLRISTSDICQFSYCRIEFGKTSGDFPDMHGGGMALLGSDAIISHCVFADNEAVADDSGMGGAIYCFNTGSPDETLTRFTDCRFLRNHCYGEGGAVKFTSDYNTEFVNCEFLENNCNYGGGAISGYYATGTTMIDCLFADNYTMYSSGGAVHTLGGGNVLYFLNCTLTGNSAVTGDGGAANLAYTTAYFANTIVYQNHGMYSDDVHLDWGSYGFVDYCNMPFPDGAEGNHNINTNPLFVDPEHGDYHLAQGSPCIDEGTDFLMVDGQIIINLNASQYCGPRPDMGAFEVCSTSSAPDDELTVLKMSQNYPNPFTHSTAISYSLPVDSFVTARIFNVRGQEVKTLVSGNQSAGTNFVSWNGRDNSGHRASQGVYFLRLQAGSEVRSLRMVLTR